MNLPKIWWGEAPARPRQLLMAMMLNDDYVFWATRPPSRIYNVAFIYRVGLDRVSSVHGCSTLDFTSWAAARQTLRR